jgi:hypothetical protein
MPPAGLRAVDRWIGDQPEPRPTRPEAIRQLTELGLASTQPATSFSKNAVATAAGIAEKVIDRLGDDSASPDVQAGRKRHLLKGPSEFREMRGKGPKPKG